MKLTFKNATKFFIIPALLVALMQGCLAAEDNKEGESMIREPVLSGTWYPANKKLLEKDVKNFMAAAVTEDTRQIRAVVVPHAGYQYSGKAAGEAFGRIAGRKYKRVIILAPAHRVGFRGIALPEYTQYGTPLGNVIIDTNIIEELEEDANFRGDPLAHKNEHAIEIQLPFLQMALKSFKLVPLIVGDVDPADYKAIAKKLSAYADSETLLVASSDYTHYGRDFGYLPFVSNIKTNLKSLDMGAEDKILYLDVEGFNNYVDNTGITICGHRPIGIMLSALRELGLPFEGSMASYYTSGDITGDFMHCVSYASTVFYETEL